MRILAISIAVGAALLAQEPARIAPPAAQAPKAPPRVDKALRSRVQFFFQAHVDGKLRLADQAVAPDSKDIFFAMQKSRYFSCEIAKIDYLDNFKRAKVTVMCEEEFMMIGAGRVRLKMPRFSDWKIVRGKWYWYVDPNALRETPFGPMKPVTRTEAANSPPTPLVVPAGPKQADLIRLVTADKTEVLLSRSEPSSDVVTITSRMRGWVTLSLEPPPLPGFEAKLDQKELKYGQQAQVTIRYTPQDSASPPPTVLGVSVQPIGKVILIAVKFQAPAPAKDKQPQ
jgi:hypothetical protein